MTGDELKAWRENAGLTQVDVAQRMNEALDRKYTGDSVRRWERTQPPQAVAVLIQQLRVSGALDEPAATATAPQEGDYTPFVGGEDTPPGAGVPGEQRLPAPQLAIGEGVWVKPCEELWEMIATGVGMIGAVTGNQALVADGAIIAEDKHALGQAWGKLAQTNETFRKMLVGMTEGGAWLQVAMVTGTTMSKCWQSHAQYAAFYANQAAGNGHVDQPSEEHTEYTAFPDAA